MGRAYTVKVVSEKEWERLRQSDPRYEYVDETNLGFADREQGVGYVRQTHWPQLNKYLLDHEFAHLLEDEGTETDAHGISHKKFFKEVLAQPLAQFAGQKVAETFLPVDPTTNPGGAAGVRALGSAGGQAVLSSVQGERAVGRSATQAGVTSLGSSLGQALPFPGGAELGRAAGSIAGRALTRQPINLGNVALQAGVSSGLSAIGNRFSTPQAIQASRISTGPPTVPGFAVPAGPSAIPTGAPTGQSSPFSRLTSGLAGGLRRFLPSGGGGGGAPPPQAPGQPGGGFLQNLVGNIATGAIGQGLANQLSQTTQPIFDLGAAGALVATGEARKTPEVPSLTSGPLAQRAIQSTQGPTTELGKLAGTRLSEQLTQPFAGLPPEVEGGLRQAYNRRRQEVTSQFKAFRPGADLATDSAYRQAIQDVDREESQALAQVQQQERERFDVGRRQDISTALGVDEQSLDSLLQLSQLEAGQIALQAGVDFATAQQFKQTMGELAGLFASRGLGLNRFTP